VRLPPLRLGVGASRLLRSGFVFGESRIET
jgi:hypothetical protein